jgi:hypothetical protein
MDPGFISIDPIAKSMVDILRLKCDGTQWRTGGEVKGKLANGVGSQYSSHYLRNWYIQHYCRRYAHLGCQQSTELTPPADLNGLVRFAERWNLVSARVPSHFMCSLPNMNKNGWNSPFTFCAGGNLCGQYDTETVYLTCMSLDFCTLHLHFGSPFPSLGCQQETHTAVWSGGQHCGENMSDRKEEPHNSHVRT